MTSRGGNVDSANTCQLRELTDQPGTDPLLGPLAANGGPTQTHALLADSPAQERAVCTELVLCPSVDQRGVGGRVFDRVDAGAYESELAPSGGGGQACTGRTERPVPADYDSWISQSAQGANFGGDSILKVGATSNGSGRALVHFPLPSVPPGCELVGATLRLYSSSATDGRTLEAVRIASAWDESGVTWANQPATAGPAATTESGLDVRAWDVLAQTRAMYTLGDHGFLIRDGATSGSGEQSFHSSERVGDRPPELVLVFDDPDGTPHAGLLRDDAAEPVGRPRQLGQPGQPDQQLRHRLHAEGEVPERLQRARARPLPAPDAPERLHRHRLREAAPGGVLGEGGPHARGACGSPPTGARAA